MAGELKLLSTHENWPGQDVAATGENVEDRLQFHRQHNHKHHHHHIHHNHHTEHEGSRVDTAVVDPVFFVSSG